MYSVGINQNKLYNSNAVGKVQMQKDTTSAPVSNPQISTKTPSFTATAQMPANIRTELTTKEEKEKYALLVASLDKKDRKKLELLLKTGILLNTSSNDKSSTLDNLHKILTTPRATGLDPNVVLKETVNTIANPFIITQKFGDIPKSYVQPVIEQAHKNSGTVNDGVDEKTIDVRASGACVAASIEFNLAIQMPAEFSRFAQELSSPKVSVDKTIQLDNLANNSLDAVWLLNAFEIPYEMKDFKEAKLKLAPDKNALMRAQIQNSNKDAGERSLVDALMQSTFMNVGSQQTYNSLTDVRHGKFNENDKGLIEFEKTFAESIVQDKNKISVTYQIVDENSKLVGYEADANTVKKHILESLKMGENIIIGYTQTDSKNTIINGHEITIIGAKTDKNGKLQFICNDTDDNNPRPIVYSEDYLIPKIHHAGLPAKIVENDVKYVDNWVQGLEEYKKQKANNK